MRASPPRICKLVNSPTNGRVHERRIYHALLLVTVAVAFLLCPGLLAAQETQGAIERIGVFIGANNGGKDRGTLQWAVSDARRMVSVMQEVGGLQNKNTLLLIQPRVADILGTLKGYTLRMSQKTGASRRSEFIFYYSGHSDEKGLLLGEETLPYGELRKALTEVKADVTVAILDSCASGAFTRQKGGVRIQPFLVDETSDMRGYAYLTSSSEDEASQESDSLAASFFTHYMASGLRGAADASGDGKVTLNEAYHYAFQETLERTEDTRAGAQHASYDIQLKGSGDLILSDLSMPNAGILLTENLDGRFYIRDGKGSLVAEVSKPAGKNLNLAVSPGVYSVRQEKGGMVYEAGLTVHPDSQARVVPGQFAVRTALVNRTRGISLSPGAEPGVSAILEDTSTPPGTDFSGSAHDAALAAGAAGNAIGAAAAAGASELEKNILRLIEQAELTADGFFNKLNGTVEADPSPDQGLQANTVGETKIIQGIEEEPEPSPEPSSNPEITELSGTVNKRPELERRYLNASAVPGVGTIPLNVAYETYITLGATVALSHRNNGLAASTIGLINSGDLTGLSYSGIFNMVGGNAQAAQIAGIYNLNQGDTDGAQIAGTFNINGGKLRGLQLAGAFNLNSGEIWGTQIGAVNFSLGPVHGVQIGLINYADSMDGIPIGLFSWVRDGIHEVNLGWDSNADSLELSFANGTKYTYSRMVLGFDFDQVPFEAASTLEGIDFGFFAGGRLGDKGFHLDIDAGANLLDLHTARTEHAPRLVPGIRAKLGLGLGDNLAIWFAPSLDFVIPDLMDSQIYEERFTKVPNVSKTISEGQELRTYTRFGWGMSVRF